MSTQPTQDCAGARELVSRALDGELEPASPERVAMDAHLAVCRDCRSWQHQAGFLQRMITSSQLEPPAGVHRSLSRSLGAAGRRTARQVLAVQAALVALAVTGFALALPALIWGQDDGIAMHASHEIGSTEVALYAGLLAAAIWPRRARGILAVLGAAAVLLVVTAASDIAAGYTTLAHESDHSVAVVGAILVWTLTRLVPEGAPLVPLLASALQVRDVPVVTDAPGSVATDAKATERRTG